MSLNGDKSEYEEDFRKFRKFTLNEIENRLRRERENIEARQLAGARVYSQMKQLIKESNIDLNRIDSITEAEEKELKKYLTNVRPQLIQREPQFETRLRQELEFKFSHTHVKSSQPHLIGADVIALDAEKLGQYEGERGNPGTWLYDANKQLKGKITHSGSPDCKGSTPYHPLTFVWYYAWMPPSKRKYSIHCLTQYHGFYAVISIPTNPYLMCQYASVNGYVEVLAGVKPGYPNYPVILGRDMKNIINKGGNLINESGPFEGYIDNSFDVNYNGPGPLYFNIILSCSVMASGSVTYCEINFEDGPANYINPPWVIISWS